MSLSITYTLACDTCGKVHILSHKEEDKPTNTAVRKEIVLLGWKHSIKKDICPQCAEEAKDKSKKAWDGCKLDRSPEMKSLFYEHLQNSLEKQGIKSLDITYLADAVDAGGVFKDSAIYILNGRARGQTYSQIAEELEISGGRANQIMLSTVMWIKHPSIIRQLVKGYK